MTWGKLYWQYWLILTSLSFLMPEMIATFTNVRNSLSDYTRAVLKVSVATHTPAWYLSLVTWVLLVVAVTVHIWWGKVG